MYLNPDSVAPVHSYPQANGVSHLTDTGHSHAYAGYQPLALYEMSAALSVYATYFASSLLTFQRALVCRL